jgi:hypothetical protein
MAASGEPFGIKVRRTPQLDNTLSGQVSVTLLLAGVFQKLLGHRLCVNPRCHVIVTFVAQHADKFSCQNVV